MHDERHCTNYSASQKVAPKTFCDILCRGEPV